MSYLDANGNVLAMSDTKVQDPWVVLESSKFPGRFYFFDTEAKKNAWALNPSLVIIDEAPIAGNVNSTPPRKINRSSSGDKLPELVPVLDERQGSRPTPLLKSPTLPSVLEEPKGSGQQMRSERKSMFVASAPKKDSFEPVESMGAVSSARQAPYQVVDGLGQGGFGVVVKVKHAVSQCPYAMKVISKAKLVRRRDRQRLALELKIMDTMGPSPFCQQFYESFETKTSVFIVMDLQRGGDLFFHLMERMANTGAAFSETELRVLLAELTLALEHVHKEGYIHRDIKVENVMLDTSGHVKLIDFGLAVELLDDVMPLSPTGSIIYMAPELVHKHSGGRHTDWWAVGILAFELLTGDSPWSTIDDMSALKEEIANTKIRPPGSVSPPTAEFIEMLTRTDFHSRLGTNSDAKVRNAPFFGSVDWGKLAALECAPAFSPAATSVCNEETVDAAREYYRMNRAEDSADRRFFSMGLPVAGQFPLAL